MTKLNQILAIEKGEKAKIFKSLTELHRVSEKPELYEGRYRTYEPLNEEGDKLPPETQNIQLNAEEVIQNMTNILAPLWDITATKDVNNCLSAFADVVVDGEVIMSRAPVTYLLFLEKQLNDVETFIQKVPTLDASQKWQFDDTQNCYTTDSYWTNRAVKERRNHVKAPATDKHPAQVEVYVEDVVVGKFTTIRYSGALSKKRKEELLDRVRKLKNAVLFAREQANSVEAQKVEVARKLFNYIVQ